MKRNHPMPFGAHPLPQGGVRFALWAPAAEEVVLELGGEDLEDASAPDDYPMQRKADGWHSVEVPDARAGDLYRYRLADGLRVPDPASRRNPGDVHGASEVVDPDAYTWHDAAWRGRPWEEAVIYEMHIGTFTPEGNFKAAERRLADLVALGVTTLEIMPLADFPGRRGWGYDGVLQFAPDATYGTPEDIKSFVDAAHELGLMVLIDVVYNHFGPEGNYLHAYCPQFFNPAHQTPWGAAINYDGEHSRTVRDFFVHNALYWVEEYHFDGLRMDAIHAIRDDSPLHIVHEICAALRKGPGATRHIHVVLENENNQASFLVRDALEVPLVGTAQWNDDIHHAGHVLTTGETDGYYIDFADNPMALFGRALAEGFVYQGQPSKFREGERRGEPSTGLPPGAFVSFLQTHDQVGNRAFGERIHALADPVLLRAAYACVLLSPHAPMLFMGEEYGASTPFQYFCDFGPELADAVSNGRREEFGKFAVFKDEAVRARIPDPNAESTFEASKLRWEERTDAPHAEWLADTTQLLSLRQSLIVPHLAGPSRASSCTCEDGTLRVDWTLGSAHRLHLVAHFGEPVQGIAPPAGEMIYSLNATTDEALLLTLERGAVYLTLEA
ncbi:Malto-oligosyltrehalose trehalohydrolase [Burkholderiales bacterium 8X]|nr:Malto-oligosyltrehalose trehalohydrolase [Burkholderiales bacterium 8X]